MMGDYKSSDSEEGSKVCISGVVEAMSFIDGQRGAVSCSCSCSAPAQVGFMSHHFRMLNPFVQHQFYLCW